jgi:hypothetical protein
MKHAFHPHTLTFKEFNKALAEIETCLNSRPLCSLNSHPEDLNDLIPARFFIGVCSSIVPDTESFQTAKHHLGRVQFSYQVFQRNFQGTEKEHSNNIDV